MQFHALQCQSLNDVLRNKCLHLRSIAGEGFLILFIVEKGVV